MRDANGNLFGTTVVGGDSGEGIIFKITPAHQFVVLHSFTYGAESDSMAGLTLGNDGNFYGTTDGLGGRGTVFEITPDGAYTTLYSFTCCDTGSFVYTPLFQAPNGNLYGGAAFYGQTWNGAIFSLNNNLSPLVQTLPTMGKVGKQVTILGNGLTGSSSVTFNGAPATFTVVSDAYIKATVPTGATTGTISVVTPSGTLNSNPAFVVTK